MVDDNETRTGEIPEDAFSGKDLADKLGGKSEADAIIDAWEADEEERLTGEAAVAVFGRNTIPLAVTDTEKARRNAAEDEAVAATKKLSDRRQVVTQEAMAAAIEKGVSEMYLLAGQEVEGARVSLRANEVADAASPTERALKYDLPLKRFVDMAVERGVLNQGELDQARVNPNRYYALIAKALNTTIVMLNKGGLSDRQGSIHIAGSLFTPDGDLVNYDVEDEERTPVSPVLHPLGQ